MKIVVINPNSSTEMTKDISQAVVNYSQGRFEAITLSTPGAPNFIDTFEEMSQSAPGMVELIRQYEDTADAFVLACACDPNLKLLREVSKKPVIGIGEASMYMAAMLGNSFAILQTDQYSIPNKKNLVYEYHMERYAACVRLADPREKDIFQRYLIAAQKAIREDGAEVIILGCAGLCTLAEQLSQTLGVPVLDGVVCGLAIAEGMARIGYQTSKVRYYSGNIS